MCCGFLRCVFWTIVVSLLALGAFIVVDKVVADRFAIFDPAVLQAVAKEAIAKHADDADAMISHIALSLAEKYPGHIDTQQQWIFNVAGGAMGQMYLLHASITEYVIIFGSPIGTDGHTGRYPFATDYFTILKGEQWAYSAGDHEKTVFKPGEMHILPRGECQAYKIPDEGCIALEYARGWVPTMLPFGTFDTIFSTLDVQSMFETFYVYGKHVIRELLQGKI